MRSLRSLLVRLVRVIRRQTRDAELRLYGRVQFAVSMRTEEIGIRVAAGAWGRMAHDPPARHENRRLWATHRNRSSLDCDANNGVGSGMPTSVQLSAAWTRWTRLRFGRPTNSPRVSQIASQHQTSCPTAADNRRLAPIAGTPTTSS